jgi:hypothetical protein
MTQSSNITADQAVRAYITIRDKVAEIKARQKNELAPYNAALEKLEGVMMTMLSKAGVESLRTSAGTAYVTERTSVTVADKSVFMDYITNNSAFDLLDVRANKTAVEGFLAEHQDLPPGLNIRREAAVNFRRA